MKHINELCKQARIKANVSQKLLAKKLGFSSSQMISNWERDLCTPPVKAAGKMATLFKVSKEVFLDAYLRDEAVRVSKQLGLR